MWYDDVKLVYSARDRCGFTDQSAAFTLFVRLDQDGDLGNMVTLPYVGEKIVVSASITTPFWTSGFTHYDFGTQDMFLVITGKIT